MRRTFGIALVALTLVASSVAVQADVVFHATFDDTLDATVGAGTTTASSAGTVAYAQGVRGKAVNITAGTQVWFSDYMPLSQGSVEIWYKTAVNTGRQTLVHSRQYDLGGDGLYLAVHGGNQVRTTTQRYDAASTDHWSDVTTDWTNGEWHQAVYTWNQSKTWLGSLYVDGVLKHSYDWNGSNVPALFGDMYVGSRPGGGWASEALMDEFVIYDTDLSAAEVEARYNNVIPEPATMCIVALGGVCGLIRRKK